jgi:hypothetical protein
MSSFSNEVSFIKSGCARCSENDYVQTNRCYEMPM